MSSVQTIKAAYAAFANNDPSVLFGAMAPDIEWYDVSAMTPAQFAAFDEPGWGRIAVAFSLRHYGASRALISYEARTATGDPDAARRFAHYWTVIRPFVGHIMRATMDTLRCDAERHSGETP